MQAESILSTSRGTRAGRNKKQPIRDNTSGTEYANVANIATVYPDGSAYVNMTQVHRPPTAPGFDPLARPKRTTRPGTQTRVQRKSDASTISEFNWDLPGGQESSVSGDLNIQESVQGMAQPVNLAYWDFFK